MAMNMNAIIGSNLQALRKASGLSQEELAAELSELGVSFQQQTILKIEKGQRPLKLDEAAAISDVLEVGLESLLAQKPTIDKAASVIKMATQVEQDWQKLREAAIDLQKSLNHLRFSMEIYANDVPDTVLDRPNRLTQLDPVKVVRDALAEGAARDQLLTTQGNSGLPAAPFTGDERG